MLTVISVITAFFESVLSTREQTRFHLLVLQYYPPYDTHFIHH